MRAAQTAVTTSLTGRSFRVTRRPSSFQIDFGSFGTLLVQASHWSHLHGLLRSRFPRAEQTVTAGPFTLRGFEQNGGMMAALEIGGHPSGIRPVFWLNEADFKAVGEAMAKADAEGEPGR